MVSMHSSRPSVTGFDSRMGCTNVIRYAGASKMKHVIIFFASKPCITVRVRAAMPV